MRWARLRPSEVHNRTDYLEGSPVAGCIHAMHKKDKFAEAGHLELEGGSRRKEPRTAAVGPDLVDEQFRGDCIPLPRVSDDRVFSPGRQQQDVAKGPVV